MVNDEEFLAYMEAHSQTERHLFSREQLVRLCKLADVPINEEVLFSDESSNPTGFYPILPALIMAYVRAARIRQGDVADGIDMSFSLMEGGHA